MWHATKLCFAADHPTAAGHFPANPIIPGALLLDAVLTAVVGEAHDDTVLIKAAKFLQAIRPGERVDLRWQSLAGSAVKFECKITGRTGLAMTGTFEIGRLPA